MTHNMWMEALKQSLGSPLRPFFQKDVQNCASFSRLLPGYSCVAAAISGVGRGLSQPVVDKEELGE